MQKTFLLLLLTLIPCAAPAKDEGDVSYSYYLISCGNYVEHRQRGAPSDTSNTADSFYVAGWLSAYNRLRPDEGIPEDTTLDDVMLWLEQYCRENPLSNIETGLYRLGKETEPRHAKAPPHEPAPQYSEPKPAEALPPSLSVQGLRPLPY